MKLFLVAVVFSLSVILRVYHIPQFMGFWYDQGRDALIISKLLSDGKLFLIGPTTGIEGIFLGPFYYYLIAPLYWLGSGNPEIPALGLGLLNVLVVVMLYILGRQYQDHKTGLIAAIIYGLSFKIAFDSRWLSNPTPLPFFALVCIWCLLKILHHQAKVFHWAILGLSLGLSLQLEAASAVFFLPVVLYVTKSGKSKIFILLLTFGLTLLPQLVFNLRHDNILLHSFQKFLIDQKSFQSLLSQNIHTRLSWYYETFSHRVFSPGHIKTIIALLTLMGSILLVSRFKNRAFWLLMFWWLTPLIFLLFYHGNNGYIWDYYFIGVYPAFILCLAWIWARFPRYLTAIILSAFLYQNAVLHLDLFRANQPTYITLANITSAVDWVYTDTAGTPFNVDVYVPPVLSDAYDYVINWRGESIFNSKPKQTREKRLYLILEPDPEHPYYRQKWLNRQVSYGRVDKEVTIDPLLIKRISRYDSK